MSKLDPNGAVIKAFVAGVRAMKNMSASDPRHWTNQARIHLNHCPHDNWFFLPWHRAYLLRFEEICRKASGDDTFALPYWNWTETTQIPAIFWDPAFGLNDTTRQVDAKWTADAEYIGKQTIDNILGTGDFETFASGRADCQNPPSQGSHCATGQLEGTPHNYIHGTILGNMGTYMSPLDPIFWLHHANVDRLWTEWNKTFTNTNDANWLNYKFAGNFVDADGKTVDAFVKELVDTIALGYRYDTQPASPPVGTQAPASATVASVAQLNTLAVQGSNRLTVGLTAPADLTNALQQVARGTMNGTATVRLTVGTLQKPANGVGVRVFLNCPYATASTPTNDPHYVSSVAFFDGGAEHGGGMPRTFLLNAAHAVRAIQRVQPFEGSGPLQVQMLNAPLRRDIATAGLAGAKLAPGRVTVALVR